MFCLQNKEIFIIMIHSTCKSIILILFFIIFTIGCVNNEESISTTYTISQKIGNRSTVPVFYPWSGPCRTDILWFDCDTTETPYSLVWTSQGWVTDLESFETDISKEQKERMEEDYNTLYLISDEWHYYYPRYRSLSKDSKFHLNEEFKYHQNSEYGHTLVINFEHTEWPGLLAKKALNYKNQGFDGLIFDWWHNDAGNGRSSIRVEKARLSIAKEIRSKVGNDFILMGNVNWGTNDPTSAYLSGVFLELWKDSISAHYPIDNQTTTRSIEAMEGLLQYWNTNLVSPKIIAFEPWKITTSDYVSDRTNETNIRYAKLFTAMVLVIADNGYILYADNNDDASGGDHQHYYYDFYKTNLGNPISDIITVKTGVAYKKYETGVIAYNRTSSLVDVKLENGKQFQINSLEGVFLQE